MRVSVVCDICIFVRNRLVTINYFNIVQHDQFSVLVF